MKFSPLNLLLCFGLISQCVHVRGQQQSINNETTIIDLLQADAELSILAEAVAAASIAELLSMDAYTLFAPVNAAFQDNDLTGDPVVWSRYLTDPWAIHLRHLLLHHVVSGALFSSNITDGLQQDTLLPLYTQMEETPLEFSVNRNDEVLVSSEGNFEDVEVIDKDILATNSVIHKVDQLFTLSVLGNSIYEAAVADEENLSIFAALIEQVDLVDMFDADIMTAFPPVNFVFSNLPDDILIDRDLEVVLLNHIILGDPVRSARLPPEIETAAGNIYEVEYDDEGNLSAIGGVLVFATDYPFSNGIGHLLSGLLLPPAIGPSIAPSAMNGTFAPTASVSPSVTALPTMSFAPTISLAPSASPVVPPVAVAPPTLSSASSAAALSMAAATTLVSALAGLVILL